MNQRHVCRNGEKNLSKISFSLRDDNICRKSVIWMYCCFENALTNVSFYCKGVYLRFKPLFWYLDAGNNSGTDLNFHWHTLDMLKVCQEVDGLPGNVGWRRDGANKRALIHTAGLGLTGPVRDWFRRCSARFGDLKKYRVRVTDLTLLLSRVPRNRAATRQMSHSELISWNQHDHVHGLTLKEYMGLNQGGPARLRFWKLPSRFLFHQKKLKTVMSKHERVHTISTTHYLYTYMYIHQQQLKKKTSIPIISRMLKSCPPGPYVWHPCNIWFPFALLLDTGVGVSVDQAYPSTSYGCLMGLFGVMWKQTHHPTAVG